MAEYRRPERLDINAEIRKALQALVDSGLTQVTIAKALEWTPTRFSRWLKGKDPRAIDTHQIGLVVTFLQTYRHAIDATIHGIEQSIIAAGRREETSTTKRRRRSS